MLEGSLSPSGMKGKSCLLQPNHVPLEILWSFDVFWQELMNCVREQVMMDYLFGRGDWTNYMPSEAGSVPISEVC